MEGTLRQRGRHVDTRRGNRQRHLCGDHLACEGQHRGAIVHQDGLVGFNQGRGGASDGALWPRCRSAHACRRPDRRRGARGSRRRRGSAGSCRPLPSARGRQAHDVRLWAGHVADPAPAAWDLPAVPSRAGARRHDRPSYWSRWRRSHATDRGFGSSRPCVRRSRPTSIDVGARPSGVRWRPHDHASGGPCGCRDDG